MSLLLQINGNDWEASFLAERVINLSPKVQANSLDVIHKAVQALEYIKLDAVVDIISSYKNIALVFDHPVLDLSEVLAEMSPKLAKAPNVDFQPKTIEVPVCYELGLDWEEVEKQLSQSRQEIIHVHSSKLYTVAMMGFLPGFLYLSGLDESLTCPRKENPRTKIPAGSVGIGGAQTGIYSLESPGGWQIIGQTPLRFFDASKKTPMEVEQGDYIRFKPIRKDEYDKREKQWES